MPVSRYTRKGVRMPPMSHMEEQTRTPRFLQQRVGLTFHLLPEQPCPQPTLTDTVPQTMEVPVSWEQPSRYPQLTHVTHGTHFLCILLHLLSVNVLESFKLGVTFTFCFHPGVPVSLACCRGFSPGPRAIR